MLVSNCSTRFLLTFGTTSFQCPWLSKWQFVLEVLKQRIFLILTLKIATDDIHLLEEKKVRLSQLFLHLMNIVI